MHVCLVTFLLHNLKLNIGLTHNLFIKSQNQDKWFFFKKDINGLKKWDEMVIKNFEMIFKFLRT